MGHQHLRGLCGPAQLQPLLPGRVPPAGAQVRGGEGGVPDQQPAPAGELCQGGEHRSGRLAVQGIGQALPVSVQPVEDAAPRVVTCHGGHGQTVQGEAVPGAYLVIAHLAREVAHPQGPEGRADQRLQIPLQPRAAVQMDLGIGIEERGEGIQPQHMVDVEMAEEDIQPLGPFPGRQDLPQGSQTRPCVQDDGVVPVLQGDAGGIAAVLHTVQRGPGGGAPDAPDRDAPLLFHEISSPSGKTASSVRISKPAVLPLSWGGSASGVAAIRPARASATAREI